MDSTNTGILPPYSGKKGCVECGTREPATVWQAALPWNSCDRQYNLKNVVGLPAEEYGDWMLRRCECCGFRWAEAPRARR